MEELNDLGVLYKKIKAQINIWTYEEKELPSQFKSQITIIGDKNIDFYKFSAFASKNNGDSIIIPNQWFYLSKIMLPYNEELHNYYDKVSQMGVFSSKRLEELKGGSALTATEDAAINKVTTNANDALRIKRFVTDYKWWHGAKSLGRVQKDYYVSAILSLSGLVNDSANFLATICEFLTLNPNLSELLVERDDDFSVNKQLIFYGAPGTGKSHEIKECTEGDDTVIRTTFHPDSDYSTFVGCYKPTMKSQDRIYSVSELINKLKGIKNPYPCQKFGAEYWRSLLNLPSSQIKKILTTCGIPTSMDTEVAKGIAIGREYLNGDDKIVYKFVQQAFTKAYIRAWEKMSKYKPMDMTFTVGGDKYVIIEIDDESIKIRKVGDDNTEAKEGANDIIIKKSELNDSNDNKIEQQNNNEQNSSNEIKQTNDDTAPKPEVDDNSENKDKIIKKIKGKIKEIGTNSFDEAWNKLKNGFINPQFLIIEEINRGNCAQIFGDLFQLLDRKEGYSEYPIEPDEDLRKELGKEFDDLKLDTDAENYINNLFKENYPNGITEKILKGELLVLPENLYIWATMNTSDQSLFPMDSAFKRRWEWKYQPIVNANKGWKIKIEGYKPIDWWEFIDRINKVIFDLTSSEDKQLGYFFCMPDKKVNDTDEEPTLISAERFVEKVVFYLWNDVFKDYSYDPDCCNKKDKKDEKVKYSDFYTEDGRGIDTKVLADFINQLKTKDGKESPLAELIKENGGAVAGEAAAGEAAAGEAAAGEAAAGDDEEEGKDEAEQQQ